MGLVVTNLHVIVDDVGAAVTLANGDSYGVVSVAAVDERRDLALLRIPGFELKTAKLGNSDNVQVGDHVYAIGAPVGLELSLSDGILSGIRDLEGYKVLQTTAAISPGSSGGGLFNSRGELVGITSFKIRGGENINFAVPINYVRGLLGVAEAKMTLSEVKAKYGSTATAARPDQQGPKLLTPPPSLPNSPAFSSTVPDLSVTYRSTQSGGTLLVKQRGNTATVDIYNASYLLIGNAVVTWDSAAKAFRGSAEVRYLCGNFDTRTNTVKSDIEYYVETGGVLRERYSRPTGLNCSRGRVNGFVWTEDRWWP
jgi:S1-C subfamily serine protease